MNYSVILGKTLVYSIFFVHNKMFDRSSWSLFPNELFNGCLGCCGLYPSPTRDSRNNQNMSSSTVGHPRDQSACTEWRRQLCPIPDLLPIYPSQETQSEPGTSWPWPHRPHQGMECSPQSEDSDCWLPWEHHTSQHAPGQYWSLCVDHSGAAWYGLPGTCLRATSSHWDT